MSKGLLDILEYRALPDYIEAIFYSYKFGITNKYLFYLYDNDMESGLCKYLSKNTDGTETSYSSIAIYTNSLSYVHNPPFYV